MILDDEPMPYDERFEPPAELDALARSVIGAAIEVHRRLGPGLPEEAYQRAMELELKIRGIPFERQKIYQVSYKGTNVASVKIDLLVGGKLVVELKSVEQWSPIHRLQTLTYLRIVHQPLGILINFNVPTLKDGGIQRVIDSKLLN